MSDIGVIYICRFPDPNFHERLTRFVRSWVEHPPGIECQVYVIYKEFLTDADLAHAEAQLSPLNPVHLCQYNGHNSYGGGCFLEACGHMPEPLICPLVSTTEIMHDNWLLKLWAAYGGGLVGCTGSRDNSTLHVRDTAILVDRVRYCNISKQFDYKHSKDGYLKFENGPNNLTQQIMRAGLSVFVVEKERTIDMSKWDGITTYRGNLENVLVHDRGARDFRDL